MNALAGKVVVVTGASRGMGRAFVDALVAAGARVACLARDPGDLDALAKAHGSAVLCLLCDIGISAMVDAAIAATVERFGKLDILVNNAAVFQPFLIEEATEAQVLAHVAVNLLGPIWCARAAIPHLRRTRGQIISVSSESVRMPFPFLTVYAATKAALETLSAGLRDELRESGIRVGVLRSGRVAGGTGNRDWHPDIERRFFETIARSGHAAFTGEAVDPATMAQTLIAVLALPADVNIDLIEARAAAPHNKEL